MELEVEVDKERETYEVLVGENAERGYTSLMVSGRS